MGASRYVADLELGLVESHCPSNHPYSGLGRSHHYIVQGAVSPWSPHWSECGSSEGCGSCLGRPSGEFSGAGAFFRDGYRCPGRLHPSLNVKHDVGQSERVRRLYHVVLEFRHRFLDVWRFNVHIAGIGVAIALDKCIGTRLGRVLVGDDSIREPVVGSPPAQESSPGARRDFWRTADRVDDPGLHPPGRLPD